jgi:hypothetical protein
MRLRSRQRAIPNGVSVYDPATKYQAPRYASFDAQVGGVIAARLANPGKTAQFKLATDRPTVENEVDRYLAQKCMEMGAQDFVDTTRSQADGGQPAPAPFPNQTHGLNPRQTFRGQSQSVAVGAEVLVEWLSSGAEAVPQAQANDRAAVCAGCPLNERGSWSRWFTVPLSNAIRAALNQREGYNLHTSHDDKLGTCAACLCPMALKVWLPLDKFLPKMSVEAKDSLDKACWIRKEGGL